MPELWDGLALASISAPERTVVFPDGSVRVVLDLPGPVIIGHGVYLPGWRWSTYVGAVTGRSSQHHFGYVLSGGMRLRSRAGAEVEAGPGDAFAVGPGHDAWVVGDMPCTALDWWPRA
ncbi:cupin domain-containing protein [Rhodococcus chondri]|uniref:Cupin n=1 Tax=Rhodococcus chondri TaxID=3065941 RepID=A0ABU7JX67_9NOCA|nr:hypothetical protein [Rhodococcus sp. CC-R104]MEE2034618.1 hypothetical protein [Rhodococcus sp. CC-R104]